MFNKFSPSKLKTLQKCYFHYYLKYVIKHPVVPDPDRDTIARDTGSALHKVLELAVQGIPWDAAARAAKEVYDTEDGFWDKHVSEHLWKAQEFLDRLHRFRDKYGVVKTYTEKKLGVLDNWNMAPFFHEGVFMRGVMDLMMVTKDGRAIIIDYKSGGTAKFGFKNYRDQLDVYKAMTLAHHPQVEGISSGIFFIKENEIMLEKNFTDASYITEVIRPQIEGSIKMAEFNVMEQGFFKHFRGSHCLYCDYNKECKNKELKELEINSKKEIEAHHVGSIQSSKRESTMV